GGQAEVVQEPDERLLNEECGQCTDEETQENFRRRRRTPHVDPEFKNAATLELVRAQAPARGGIRKDVAPRFPAPPHPDARPRRLTRRNRSATGRAPC